MAGLRVASGEHAPVVREHGLGDAVGAKRLGEALADRASGGAWHRVGQDAVPGVVIDPGQDLHRRAALEARLHDVELPQLHRAGSLPADVVRALAPPGPRFDEPGADQDPIDARARRHRIEPPSGELVGKALGSPPRMLPSELDHLQLRARRCAVRAAPWPLGPIDQPGEPALPIAPEPVVQALARHAEVFGHLGHGRCSFEHFLHRVVALFHDRQLHQHNPDLLPGAASPTRAGQARVSTIWWSCQRSGGTVQSISRSRSGKHLPESHTPS